MELSKITELSARVEEIATELSKLDSENWVMEPDKEPNDWCRHLNSDQGLVLSIRQQSYGKDTHYQIDGGSPSKSRWHNRQDGYWLDHKAYAYSKVSTSINVSKSKTAQKIAQDINRRLLPIWRDIATRTTASYEAWKKEQQKQDLIFESMAITCGYSPSEHQERDRKFSTVNTENLGSYLTVKVNHSTCVELTVELTPQQALKLIDVIKTL